MENSVTLYCPVAPRADGAALAPLRVAAMAGAVVGFIDNSKPNFSHLVDDLATLLTEAHGVAKIIRHRKRAPNIPIAPAVADELARECDLVITGSGD